MKRAALALLLVGTAACERPGARAELPAASAPASAPPASASRDLLPPRAPWLPSPSEHALATCKLGPLGRSTSHGGFFEGTCGDARVLVLPATVAQPQRFRPQVALYRLAKRAGFEIVPTTALRSEPVSRLYDVLPKADVADLVTDPSGAVSFSITALPEGKLVPTRYSNEGAAWARLAVSPTPLAPADAITVDDWLRIVALDYVTANLFRQTVWATPDGHLWVTDARTAFVEHPSPDAVDQSLDKLKKSRRVPHDLALGLGKLTREALDDDLRAGSFEEWLVAHRALGEVHQRARAAHGWAIAAAQPSER